MKNFKKGSSGILVVIVIALLVVATSALYLEKIIKNDNQKEIIFMPQESDDFDTEKENINTTNTEIVACTKDAMQCPDGSFIGRTGPNCEFVCPSLKNNTDVQIVGGDRDKHGCIGSAGYIWCEAKQKCLRTWEEKCEITNLTQEEQSCMNSGGQVTEQICNCPSGEDFFNTCEIGACSCPPNPEYERVVKVCNCGDIGMCWNGEKCVDF